MPIHDWTRVDHGTFHDFHQGWGPMIRSALNKDILPEGYSAMVEQHADRGVPDVLALEIASQSETNGSTGHRPGAGPLSVATAPPKATFMTEFRADEYARLRKTIVIRRGEDRVVALIEIVSPGNKSNRHGIRAFVEKVVGAVENGLHVVVLDLFPPGPRDPNGIHPLIWSEFRDDQYEQPIDRPLSFISYAAGAVTRALIEPEAVGNVLPEIPLFLTPELYVELPLEQTYSAAFEGITRSARATLMK